jgi:flagellar L-ring protein precursor FlgH
MKLSLTMIGVAFLLSACGAQKLRELGKEPEMSPVGTGMKYSNASQVMTYPTQPKKRVSEFSLWSDHKSALFQDTRAMSVGDILTVNISINDKASFENESERSRKNSSGFNAGGGVSTLLGRISAGSSDLSYDSNASSTGDGSTKRAEQLNIRVAAIVTGIMDNGNLIISGSQEVRVNFELRILNVAGIVRPKDIDTDNMIAYEKIAEARISYGGRGRLTEVQQPPIGQQVVDVVTPF